MVATASGSSASSREESLFEQALALAPSQRASWLARACGPDDELRRRMTALLRAHEQAEAFMESPAPGVPSPHAAHGSVEEKPGDRIGRYKLLQKIGEGGCGVVYMAEQEEAVQRRVALKVIKAGMDTRAVVARFEAERQALARMEHPNIARVLDAGATQAGRPFFVMELVRGLRITEYCDRSNLSTEERLGLFITVCHAIQHAHQKGIIHRDIKPSNILVTLHDGEPVPKVIDFGIAKATQGRLTEQTLFTAFEQFIGTPAYVSPEQAEMSSLEVDTRSDIYSLGVLLYELLMGCTPFDGADLAGAGLQEMRRRLREQEPPRPSRRLRTLNDSDRTTVARRRGTDAPRLVLQLRGDLDWIVMRCLEKDRARRYDTAGALAADIQRHLRNEPVTARPPSTAYLLQKLIRRHRLAFLAGAGITTALAAGFTVSTSLYVQERAMYERAREAEATARSQMKRAETASANEGRLRAEAESARNRAQDESLRRAALAQLMGRAMKEMGLLIALGGDAQGLHEVLDQTASLKKELRDQPDLEAGLDETLGGAYFKMGDFKRAEELFLDALALRRRAQGEASPAVAESLNHLGQVYAGQSRWRDAEARHREALDLQQRAFGAQHVEVARTLSTLGWVLAQQARLDESAHYLRLALGQLRHDEKPQPADIAATLMRLGSVLTQEGRIQEAETSLREALELNRGTFGHSSLEAAASLNLLAVTIAMNQVRLPDAIDLYREAVEIRERRARPAFTETSAGGEARALRPPVDSLLGRRESMAEVSHALREAQQFVRLQYARGSWEEAFYLALHAWVLLQEGKFTEAEASARQCLALRLQLRPDDWSVCHARHLLGAALAGQLRREEAEPLLIGGYRGMQERAPTIPPFHQARLGESVQRIIQFYAESGRTAEVAAWQRELAGLQADATHSLLQKTPLAPRPLAALRP